MIPCIKQKKFLFIFSYRTVEHNYKIWKLAKFMDCSDDFEVTYKCSECGIIYQRHFVSADRLLLDGIDAEIIKNITTTPTYLD